MITTHAEVRPEPTLVAQVAARIDAWIGPWTAQPLRLAALDCGEGLDADMHMDFRDTIPAVCWAVPGAMARLTDG